MVFKRGRSYRLVSNENGIEQPRNTVFMSGINTLTDMSNGDSYKQSDFSDKCVWELTDGYYCYRGRILNVTDGEYVHK